MSMVITFVECEREAWAEMPVWVRGRLWAVKFMLQRASVDDGLKP